MVADAELLRDLRERVLDESETLVGLLRTCLALGTVTGSDALRSWARSELKGYETGTEVPTYRKLRLPLYLDSFSISNILVRDQSVSRYMAPAEAQKLIPEQVSFKDPIEQLIGMAETGENHQIRLEGLKFAASEWNAARKDDDPWIVDLYYKVSATAVAGVVSVVRTTLVEMVMDMAKDVPLDQLPTRREADAAVQVHVYGSRDEYHLNVDNNRGVIGQGTASTQAQHRPPHSVEPPRQRRWNWFRRSHGG
ncbi:AbiTii domain-containing protein [Nocardia gipuzkoensis]